MTKFSGYSKRPWWLIIAALFFLFLPLIALAIRLHQFEPSGLFSLKMWQLVIAHFQISNWLLVSLSWTIAILIYRTTKASFILLSLIFLIIIIVNFVLLKKVVLVGIFIPLILWVSPFRKPYFNRAMRWWEQLPRFWLESAKDLILINEKKARIVNLSLSGVLIKPIEEPFVAQLEESVLLKIGELNLKAVLKRMTQSEFGFQFDKLSLADKRKLKHYLNKHKMGQVR